MRVRKRTGKVWLLDIDDIQQILDESSSMVEACGKIGLDPHNGAIRSLYTRIRVDQLDMSILKSNRRAIRSSTPFRRPLTLDAVFVENSTTVRSVVRRYVLKYSLIPYTCAECENSGQWRGRNLSLQLEHKNGINNDHRLENLCWLCPNCHTQTATYAGRNSKLQPLPKPKMSRPRKFDPTEDELRRLVNITSMMNIGRKFGVSDNAVRKRCKLLGII